MKSPFDYDTSLPPEDILPENKKVTATPATKATKATKATPATKATKPTTADILLEIVELNAPLFHDAAGRAWARPHGRCYPVHSTKFRRWLQRQFYNQEHKTPHSQALQDVLDQVSGKALFDAPEQHVHVRTAYQSGNIIIDLGGDHSVNKIQISSEGWTEGANDPVNFWRPSGMNELPVPERGGKIAALRSFVNTGSDRDFRLLVAWLLAALNPGIACPILVLQGEQGSAKSTTSKVLRCLLDPNSAPIRSAPRDERELVIQAQNSRVLCLDNLSGLKGWLSDALCRICTGGGFSTRRLYTNDEEQIFSVRRPIILNGIDDIATRGDLLDRSIVLNLPAIPDSERKDERTFFDEFKTLQPFLLGALLDGVAAGLSGRIQLGSVPRMADFAEWISSCEGAFGWKQGTLLVDYNQNRGQAVETGLDSDILAAAIRLILKEKNPWESNATKLVEKIAQVSEVNERYLPTTRTLKGRLTRLAPALRQVGITWEYLRTGSSGGRTYVLEYHGKKLSEVSVASEPEPKSLFDNGLEADGSSDSSAGDSSESVSSVSKASEQKQPPEPSGGDTDSTDTSDTKKQPLSKNNDWDGVPGFEPPF